MRILPFTEGIARMRILTFMAGLLEGQPRMRILPFAVHWLSKWGLSKQGAAMLDSDTGRRHLGMGP